MRALFPTSGWASRARWYATSDRSWSKRQRRRARSRSPIRRGSELQKRPWWTISIWAPSSAARSKSSSDALTPVATLRTSGAPTTWRPTGSASG